MDLVRSKGFEADVDWMRDEVAQCCSMERKMEWEQCGVKQ